VNSSARITRAREARSKSEGAKGVWGCLVDAMLVGRPRMKSRKFWMVAIKVMFVN
jgi:hypothetical protein